MNSEQKRREPGKRAFPSRPKLVLVPPAQPNRPAPNIEPSQEVKEMLREMNRRHVATRNSNAPDAA
jgi:hypothetical protein